MLEFLTELFLSKIIFRSVFS